MGLRMGTLPNPVGSFENARGKERQEWLVGLALLPLLLFTFCTCSHTQAGGITAALDPLLPACPRSLDTVHFGWTQSGDPEMKQCRNEEWADLTSGISLPTHHQRPHMPFFPYHARLWSL